MLRGDDLVGVVRLFTDRGPVVPVGNRVARPDSDSSVGMSMRARIRAGDPDAFGELFDEHARSVYNHAFRLTGAWPVAEGVVSLTFLEAWRLRDRLAADADWSLRPWLLGIATNVARNLRRAARRYDAALARIPRREAVLADFADKVTDRVDAWTQTASQSGSA